MTNMNESERRELLAKTERDILSIEAGLDQMWEEMQAGREHLESIASYLFECGEHPAIGIPRVIARHPDVPVAELIMQGVSSILALCHHRELVVMRDRLKASLPE